MTETAINQESLNLLTDELWRLADLASEDEIIGEMVVLGELRHLYERLSRARAVTLDLSAFMRIQSKLNRRSAELRRTRMVDVHETIRRARAEVRQFMDCDPSFTEPPVGEGI